MVYTTRWTINYEREHTPTSLIVNLRHSFMSMMSILGMHVRDRRSLSCRSISSESERAGTVSDDNLFCLLVLRLGWGIVDLH